MTDLPIQPLLAGDPAALPVINRRLDKLGAADRVRWALEFLPGAQVVSSSFGIQAAL